MPPGDLRCRVITGLARSFQAKRLQGLLSPTVSGELGWGAAVQVGVLAAHGDLTASRLPPRLRPQGLRILSYSCEMATESAEHHPGQPLRIWAHIEKEIRGGAFTRLVALTLAATLRRHRASPAWWQAAWRWPFILFSGLLRRHLGKVMLSACEAAVEFYIGLLASQQVQVRGGRLWRGWAVEAWGLGGLEAWSGGARRLAAQPLLT